MSVAARLGQLAVVLVICGACTWLTVQQRRRRRDLALERFRDCQEP